MRDVRLVVWLVMAVLPVLATGLGGCASSGGGVAGGAAPPQGSAGQARVDERALQHMIDGSTLQARGEHAQAILEFQDALRTSADPAIFYAMARSYAFLGRHVAAIEAGREAVGRDPGRLDYRRMLAEVYLAAVEPDSAAAQYEQIILRDSSAADAWYQLARIFQVRRPLRALEVYDHILARFGPDWEVLLQIAELNNRMGRFDRAAEALGRMVELDPANQALRRTLAQTTVRAGSYDRALAILTGLRELDPGNLDYRTDIAGVYLLQKEYARAAAEFDSVLARDTVALEVKLRIGELYFAQLERDSSLAPAARSLFERIRDRHPEDWRAYWFLGAIGSLTHNDSLTVRSFRTVTRLASWNADAWVYLSSVFLGSNNFTEVAAILESAVRAVPEEFRVNFLLGVAYSRLGRSQDAVRALEAARRIKPTDVDAVAQLALVYDGMKRYADSDSLYEEALRLDAKNHLVLNNYAYSLAERGLQLERALTMARAAVEAQPANPSYLDTIGWVYYRLGRYRDAERYVREAVGKGEVNAVVYEHLGDIYARLSDRERALEYWNMALKLDANNAALRDKISRGGQ